MTRKGNAGSAHKWNTADTITAARMAAAIAMLFLPVYSAWFYAIYTLAGLSDAVDGSIARSGSGASDFGARLDSIADLMFYSVMMIRIFPDLWRTLPRAIWIMVGAILAVRLAAYATAAIKYRRFAALHTYMNKVTGGAVFLLPYMHALSATRVYGWIACALGMIASVEELLIHVTAHTYRADRKSIFIGKGEKK